MSDTPSKDRAGDPGAWKVEVTSPALKGFRQLPEKAAAAIVEFVTGPLAHNPRRLSKALTNELLGLRTARRGDYRVLFTLDLEQHVLYVHRIEHRIERVQGPVASAKPKYHHEPRQRLALYELTEDKSPVITEKSS